MNSTVSFQDAGIDRAQTEALLFDLATTLLRLPFEGRTRSLHIRALELKRRVGQWGPSVPTEDEQLSTRECIIALRREVAQWCELLR